MSTWYVSSVAYAAIAAWQASHAYSVGDIVRPTAAAAGQKTAHRCITAGTSGASEPGWSIFGGGTTTSGTATFQQVNGDTYGWSAACGDLMTPVSASGVIGFGTIGDTFYLSSDHSESVSAYILGFNIGGTWSTAATRFISVDRAGSVPPTAADLAPGAAVGAISNIGVAGSALFDGITFSASANFSFGYSSSSQLYFKNCTIALTSASASNYFDLSGALCAVILDNTALSFSNAGQKIVASHSTELTWLNTAAPLLGAAAPTYLFENAQNYALSITMRGLDLSGFAGTLLHFANPGPARLLLDSCKISGSMTPYSETPHYPGFSIEYVNCHDGSAVRNERIGLGGAVSTERSIVLTGGAADDIGGLSFKMATGSSYVDKSVWPLENFWFDVENTAVGASKTATIEIVASAALNSDEVWMRLEYMGGASNSLASFVDTLAALAPSALATSAAAWDSAPSTPVYQKLTAPFTPQRAGRVRAQVFLGKPSTTIYVNPQIAIS